ncbi:2-amino-4-hydroxy-6-hydroxymethyldihydropteridine diphosphokinase [Celerinatantimonas yamalensis]|uniref:2-amino-4-hydroxy-6-hydroxymethyldihydropteridine pyrophosphokinase n=1 Tax=Celerinatantimonas yamalensis TaxID=559956 RepID=A0ABW9G737_9GAMM
MLYLCSLGSNIDPQQHVPEAVSELVYYFNEVTFSSFIYTQPRNMASEHVFVNSLFKFTSSLTRTQIKAFFNQLEIAHGRDRSDPNSSSKDRVLDLDILNIDASEQCFDIPDYLHTLYQELTQENPAQAAEYFTFNINNQSPLQLGHRATTVNRDACSS